MIHIIGFKAFWLDCTQSPSNASIDTIAIPFQLAVLTLFALGCKAADYSGAGLSGGSSYGSLGSAYGAAPIQTHRTVELRQPQVLHQDYAQPQIIDVNADNVPVQVHFRTAGSRVNVQQSHTPGAPAQVEHASFQDEPHRVVHEVVKPVIQEVREIIQPYRRVTQEIRPVIEEVHTVVHKGEGRRAQGGPGLGAQGGYGGAGLAVGGNGYKSAKGKARA